MSLTSHWRYHLASGFVLVALVGLAGKARGDFVDFENAAKYGGDDSAIDSSYFSQYGLQISAMVGASAETASSALLTFEAAGADGTDAYWSSRKGRDEAYRGDIGNYLLKAGASNMDYKKARYFKMSIDYDIATQAASGEIWDIDGKEKYAVTALDANGNALATLTSPRGGLNAAPWSWSFDVGKDASIHQIEVEFVSDKSNLRGFAFDNFNATAANGGATAQATPLPAALPLGLVGMAALALRRRQHQQQMRKDSNLSDLQHDSEHRG